MAKDRDKSHWLHTTQMLAVMANGLLKKRDGGTFKPSDFDPYKRAAKKRKPQKKLSPEEGVLMLARALSGG